MKLSKAGRADLNPGVCAFARLSAIASSCSDRATAPHMLTYSPSAMVSSPGGTFSKGHASVGALAPRAGARPASRERQEVPGRLGRAAATARRRASGWAAHMATAPKTRLDRIVEV